MKNSGLPPIKLTSEQNIGFGKLFELSILTAALLKGHISQEGFTKIVESRLSVQIGEKPAPKNRRL